MKKYDIYSKNFRPHFIGAGGVSMSGLAKFFIVRGCEVSGSDKAASNETEKLVRLGAKINIGHKGIAVKGATAVIYSSAISSDNPELKQAEKLSLPVIKRSVLLGKILKGYNRSVCVCGSHGKTTATAMISEILIRAGKNPAVFLGGESNLFGNFRSGDGIAIAEACEYKRNFLDISPDIAVVLNIDNDHLDSYSDIKDEINAFSQFTKNALTIVNADDKNAEKVYNASTVTFGLHSASYTAKRLCAKENGYSFTVYIFGKRAGRINLNITGKHNVYNALAAVAACDTLKVPFKDIKYGLEHYSGVKRRNESLGFYCGKEFIADYAHHPAEIAATLKNFKETGAKTLCVFQPHTYSRTSLLMADFLKVLSTADGIIIYKTYPAREKYDVFGDAKTLYENLKRNFSGDCFYAGTEKELVKNIKTLCKGYQKIAIIGAGDVYFVVKNIFFKKNEKIN